MGHLVYIEANSTLSMKEGLHSKGENIITKRNSKSGVGYDGGSTIFNNK